MSEQKSDVDRLIDLLESLDVEPEIDSEEYERELSKIESVMALLSQHLNMALQIFHEQDATFFASVTTRESTDKFFSIHFSSWGRLVAVVEGPLLSAPVLKTIERLLQSNGFVYVSRDVYSRPYQGSDPIIANVSDATWWDRYFSHY